MKKFLYFVGIVCCLTSCKGVARQGVTDESSTGGTGRITVTHAEGFKVTYTDDDVCLVDIQDPEKESANTYHYALVPKGREAKNLPEGYDVINTPVKSVLCMTSLQLSNFICLEELDEVVGVTSTRHLFNSDVKERLADGRIHKIGMEGNFDNEVVIGINPELILISPFKRGGYDALREVDIPLIPHLGYKETTPLGQAEWIKFVALLVGQEAKANELFDGMVSRYEQLKALAAQADNRPVVFSGEMRGGNWYAVGGKSFLACLFTDAGADYFLKDDTHTGGMNLDYEVVYQKAANADYWRIVNSYNGEYSYDVLGAQDSRYTDFKAFKEHGVVYCNMTVTPFYESMPVEPDKILADFIHVFHPELLPDHQPVYYSLLP